LASRNIPEKLREGIEAARRGDKTAAQRLLRQVVDDDPGNEVAWMWLASTAPTLEERRSYLERVLKLNPKNTRAREALDQLAGLLPATSVGARAQQRTPARAGGSGLPVGYIVAGAAALVLVIVAIVFASALTQRPAPPNEATRESILALPSNTPAPTAGPSPTPTASPFYGVIVEQPTNNATLPPTFTPTFTSTPSDTPTPTATPYPMSQFMLLYTTKQGDAQAALFQSAGDGGGDKQIGDAADGFNDPAYDPSGQKVAFVRTVTYKKDDKDVTSPELFIAPVDKLGEARQVTKMGTSHLASPTWSPDGIQLVFVSNFDGVDKLWYITEDGNNLRQLTTGKWADKDPAWSPTDDVIVFASEQANKVGSGLTELFSITSDGKDVKQLTDDNNSSYSPSWSPDGRHIAFASDRLGTSNIYIMNADGQGTIGLTFNIEKVENRHPVFTPDGEHLVFASNRDSKPFQLYIMDLKTSEISRLTSNDRDIDWLQFRPEPLLKLQQTTQG
jgi:Tol biopolymer transport system component